jgi:serine/threonine protein kinase
MFRLHFKQFNKAPPTTCEFYRIGRVLGKGAFGKVNFAMHKLSEQLVAIKSMSKETLQSEEDLRRRTKLEMGILQQSNHPNVVRLFDTFETQKHICFVMELCSGGDLFSYIKKRRRLKEDVARFFFRQIIEGLAYIHNAKLVVHRDIKLENILLDATG